MGEVSKDMLRERIKNKRANEGLEEIPEDLFAKKPKYDVSQHFLHLFSFEYKTRLICWVFGWLSDSGSCLDLDSIAPSTAQGHLRALTVILIDWIKKKSELLN